MRKRDVIKRTLFTLDKWGLLAALVMGALILYFGSFGGYGMFFILVLIWFLALSALATSFKKEAKKRIGVYERARGWKNVVANGAVPFIVAMLFFLNMKYDIVTPTVLVVSYVASVGAVAADKFSSEIGVLGGKPVSIISFKEVEIGKSGGISFLGSAAGVFASMLVALSLFNTKYFTFYFLVVVAASFIGNVFDSIFGHFEENGIGNKYTSNAACSLIGFVSCFLILIYLA